MQTETHPFPRALADGDLDTLSRLLAPEVVLHSPILARYRFVGHDEVLAVLASVSRIVAEPEIVEDFGDAHRRLLVIRGRIGARSIEVADVVRLDETGRVREMKIFARPLPGLTALMAALGPQLARRNSVGRGVLTTVMARPLAALSPAIERAAERLIATRGHRN